MKGNLSLLGLTAQPGLIQPALALPNHVCPTSTDLSRQDSSAGSTQKAGLRSSCAACAARITSDGGSHLSLDHHALDLGDSLGRIETLRTGFGAIHDGVAAVEAERIFEIVEAPSRRLVPAVPEPAMGLQPRGRDRK